MGECIPCCDYCEYYVDDYENGIFSGGGKCVLKHKEVSALGGCDDFRCSIHPPEECHVDVEMFGETYDHCMLDLGMYCEYAVKHNIKNKKECKNWK